MADEEITYNWRPAFELLLEESRRSIDRQMTSVREARQRAGSLVGYASVIAAALGFSVDSGALGPFGWTAIIAFLIVGSSAMAVLYPRRFHQDLRASRIDAWFEDPANTGVDHMLRSAALAHDENYAHNLNRVIWLHRGIMAAVFGLMLEAGALVLKLVL